MKVTATRTLYVDTPAGSRLLNRGESAEVDGRTYSDNHPFVKSGYLIADKPERTEQPKRGRKPKQGAVETEDGEQGGESSTAGEE